MNRIVTALVAALFLCPAATLALDLTPDQKEQVKLESVKWMANRQKAEALTKQKKFQEAETIWKETIADRKKYSLDLLSEYDGLGALYLSWGKKNEAEQVFKDMVAAREQLNGPDEYPQSIADFDKAIALNPSDASTMGSRAALFNALGKYKEAVEGYTKTIAVDPATYWPYLQRGEVYKNIGNYRAAIDDYTTVIDRAPQDPDYYEYRAAVYTKAGQLKNAIADYDKIVELNPKNSIVYHERAKIYEKLDGKKTARVIADDATAKKLGY